MRLTGHLTIQPFQHLRLLFRYFAFWLRSGNAHAIHSPFVFDLYNQVIRYRRPHDIFKPIEAIRERLLTDHTEIAVADFGAGSRVTKLPRRSIQSIAHYAQKNARLGQLLFRLVQYTEPSVIVDLGTSLGITTLYLAAPYREATVYTLEGCSQTLAVAKKHFAQMNFSHIIPVQGNIDTTLPATLEAIERLDFTFVDANHRLEPTLRYFRACLEKSHEDTVLVFDDIYWSEEMMEAWAQIKAHEAVTLTVDLFYVGLVFFRKKQPKQHFKLRL